VVDLDTALGQQFLDIAVRQAEPQLPPDGERDHLRRELEPGERRERGGHRTDRADAAHARKPATPTAWPDATEPPVFFNQHGSKLSRGGIAWITRKYQTTTADPILANADITPHTLRHYVNGWVVWPVEMFPLVAAPRDPFPAT
jgi:hypothetical protein